MPIFEIRLSTTRKMTRVPLTATLCSLGVVGHIWPTWLTQLNVERRTFIAECIELIYLCSVAKSWWYSMHHCVVSKYNRFYHAFAKRSHCNHHQCAPIPREFCVTFSWFSGPCAQSAQASSSQGHPENNATIAFASAVEEGFQIASIVKEAL